MITVNPATLNLIYAAACQIAGVLAFVYTVALLCSRALPGVRR